MAIADSPSLSYTSTVLLLMVRVKPASWLSGGSTTLRGPSDARGRRAQFVPLRHMGLKPIIPERCGEPPKKASTIASTPCCCDCAHFGPLCSSPGSRSVRQDSRLTKPRSSVIRNKPNRRWRQRSGRRRLCARETRPPDSERSRGLAQPPHGLVYARSLRPSRRGARVHHAAV